MFEGKYQQFLFRHKGTEINSKEDIINLLNRKPRSFLTTLNILVKTFKNYDHLLTAHISKLHPKQITNLTKKTSNITNSSIEITKLSNFFNCIVFYRLLIFQIIDFNFSIKPIIFKDKFDK